eukprot:CFRG2303T1
MKSLRIIDLSLCRFDSHDVSSPALREICRQWKNAMSECGFAIITGHGVDPSILQKVLRYGKDFFAQPLHLKEEISVPGGYGTAGGYNRIGKEAVGRSHDMSKNNVSDYVESLTFNQLGAKPDPTICLYDDFNMTIEAYSKAMKQLVQGMMRLTAVSLNLNSNHFDECFQNGDYFLKLSWYPEQCPPDAGRMRYSAHTDYQCITILKVEDVPGLEVYMNEEWVPWTNDVLKSAIHRVACPSLETSDTSHKGRLSIVFFSGPSPDTIVAPIKECIEIGSTSKYAPITAGEYLKMKVSKTQTG